jgi:hypothetical protein
VICVVSRHRGSAALGERQCRTLQTITTSFLILTASLYGVGIYTYLMPPGRAADVQITLNPFQAIRELSPTLSL